MPARGRGCAGGCLTGEGLLETVDGPVAIGGLVGKSITVMTRLPNGRIGFRLFSKIAVTASGVAVVRVSFDNGQAIVVDEDHVFYGEGRVERPVATLVPGELLDSSAHFPKAYVYRRMDGSTEVSAGAVAVAQVEPVGIADVYGGVVNETGAYFVSAGVLCKA